MLIALYRKRLHSKVTGDSYWEDKFISEREVRVWEVW